MWNEIVIIIIAELMRTGVPREKRQKEGTVIYAELIYIMISEVWGKRKASLK